jgi:hypothetical protein
MMNNDHPLTDEELGIYADTGFVVVRGAVPEDARQQVIGAMQQAVEKMARSWKDEGFLSDTCDNLPFATRWAALRRQVPPKYPVSWRRILVCSGVYQLWQRPEILGRARSVLGNEVYAHGIWNGRPREPGTASTQRVHWHQDAHYYKDWAPSDGKLVSCWMPLVPVDERSGCLQFLPGSQRGGRLERVKASNGLFMVPEQLLEGYEPVSVPGAPGDLIIFSDTTVHRALDNVSDYVRWSFDIRFGQATPEIISKSNTGYYCFSAADPARVESCATWLKRHEYTYEELLDMLETRASSTERVTADDAARALGVTRTELDAF